MPKNKVVKGKKVVQKCTDCKILKKLEDFTLDKSRPLGHDRRCRYCNRIKNLKFYKKNPNYLVVWAKSHKEEGIKKVQRWREKNKEKVEAHQKIAFLLKTGKLKRGKCAICGDIKTDGHHPDYSKPSEVIWLCRQHHKDIHSKLTQ